MDNVKQTSEVNISDAALPETLPAVDAIIHIKTTDKDLEAYINIEPPQNGGAAPTFEVMQAALSACGISYNVNFEKLKEIEAAPVYNSNMLIACGVAPVDGANGTASFWIKTEKNSLKPKENEDGSVDFYDLDIVENVMQGQILCSITLPTEGSPGISVKGMELRQNKGRPVPSCLGNNTELNEDGTAVLSKINGQVDFTGNKIHVNETFYVKENIDSSTGNIKVANNLVVQGMVLPGFKIEAGRNIDVRGTVEASTIVAGGDIKLHSGITGSELHCDGDLKCRFIENCDIFVKGNIKAEYIINSSIKCGIGIKIVGMRAKIIGGSCMAGQNIEAQTIGSPAGTHTRLELGTDPAVIQRQQKLLAQVAQLEKPTKSLRPLLTMLRQLEATDQLTPEKKQILDSVGYSYDTNIKLMEEATRELEEINQTLKTRGFGRIICTDTVHPGTSIVIGDASLSVKEALYNVSLYYKEGAVGIGPARS